MLVLPYAMRALKEGVAGAGKELFWAERSTVNGPTEGSSYNKKTEETVTAPTFSICVESFDLASTLRNTLKLHKIIVRAPQVRRGERAT
jgi:hypothetical protein